MYQIKINRDDGLGWVLEGCWGSEDARCETEQEADELIAHLGKLYPDARFEAFEEGGEDMAELTDERGEGWTRPVWADGDEIDRLAAWLLAGGFGVEEAIACQRDAEEGSGWPMFADGWETGEPVCADGDPPIRFTCEGCEKDDDEGSNVAPVSYWLESWRNHADACEAIERAANGSPSRFQAPGGMIYVSREG